MMNQAAQEWCETNQRCMIAAMAEVRGYLDPPARWVETSGPAAEMAQASSSALETICRRFGLSPFERLILILCAGVELDAEFAKLCAGAQGDPRRIRPTFGLALAALPGSHWSAIAPVSPLRRWRLINVGSGDTLTTSPLSINERVLHYLAGISHPDERLAGAIEVVHHAAALVPSHHALARRMAQAWAQAKAETPPLLQLCGGDATERRAIASAASASLGLCLFGTTAAALPTAPAELDGLLRLWEREAALSNAALLLEFEDDAPDAARSGAASYLAERLGSPLILASRERRGNLARPVLNFDVPRPTPAEQRDLWTAIVGSHISSVNGSLEVLTSQFNLRAHAICSAGAQALGAIGEGESPDVGGLLWDACRQQTGLRLGDLSQRITPASTLDDVVLPELQHGILRQIVAQVKHRARVYESWGFARKSARGLGIGALFAGASGTGKTMAAEALASELRLDLFRIDLSAVISKYIGETEKNLRRVFDAAEDGGAVLLFDEADALFGKRSEVKDSHDRYANIEISYLLQRMEAYRGLAILTTNMKNALDTAFLRRLRFVVEFPFPDAAHRAEIWRRIFPSETPTEGLNVRLLSRLNVPGGHIRNIALSAAFLAASEDRPVQMAHVLKAVRGEYYKLEKPLSEGEVLGWI